MADNEKRKKDSESNVLKDVLGCCLKQGGAKGRNAKRFTGRIDASAERPDIAVPIGDNHVVGLEHFRVDHFVGKGKKVESNSARLSSRLESERRRVAGIEDEDRFMVEAANVLGEGIQQEMGFYLNASLDDLLKSLEARLGSDVSGHLPKVPTYRENLRSRYAGVEKIELGFLIELHTDFRGLFLHEGRRQRRLVSGQCPLFDVVYDQLLAAAHDVDWILLGFYATLESGIVDAAVIDCRNGKFKKAVATRDCIEQGFLNSIKHCFMERARK